VKETDFPDHRFAFWGVPLASRVGKFTHFWDGAESVRSLRNPMGICFFTLVLSFVGSVYGQGFLPPIQDGPTSSEAGTVNESVVVLQELSANALTHIPEQLLQEAAGIAIIPHYVRGAFVIGVAGGRGVLASRDATGKWQAPELVTMAGGSLGWQVGVQATDLVLVFRTPRSLANIRQGKLTLGADASAAAGPVGRYASAATDASLQAEILTYSRSRGLFAGVSLSGASLQLDRPATERFYNTARTNPGSVPASALALINELNRLVAPLPNSAAGQSGAPDSGILPPAAAAAQTSSALTQNWQSQIAELNQSVTALQAKVDAQWSQYLALPPNWVNSTMPPQSADIQSMLVRYERVETNPQFAALRNQPEFQQSLSLLRRLSADAMASNPQLVLPPPPGGTAQSGTSPGRY